MHACSWLLILSLLAVSAAGADPIQLPDMGASSATVLSPQKEAEVGREVMRQLRRAGAVVDDPFVEDYIERVGYRLLSVADAGAPFTFFVLDDPAINAFALPGGFVGVNAGLITASRSESELAGVLAHEISHVTQSHIARGLEQANRLNLPMTAAIVAALVLGGQDPQVGQAAIASALASSTQSRLDFSRSFEQEADRVGMGLLAQAGFDPDGMPSFFERLYEETRFSGGEAAELEFLRTHPVTVSRIADSRNRAEQYGRKPLKTSADDYEYAKAMLRVRTARDSSAPITYFQEAVAKKIGSPVVAQLGLALAFLRADRPQDAQQAIARARARNENAPLLLRLSAEVERKLGQDKKAEELLRRASQLYPEDQGIAIAHTRLLLDAGRHDDATALISGFLRHRESPQAYALLAEAETARGKHAAAHLALAEKYYRMDEIRLAIDQLRVARRDTKADFYTLSRIDARLSEFENLLPAQAPVSGH